MQRGHDVRPQAGGSSRPLTLAPVVQWRRWACGPGHCADGAVRRSRLGCWGAAGVRGQRAGSMGAVGSRRSSAAFDATGSVGAMIEMLREVLVAIVGLGRVKPFGIHETVAWPRRSHRDLREKPGLFSRRAHAQNRRGTHSPGRGDLPRLAIPARASS